MPLPRGQSTSTSDCLSDTPPSLPLLLAPQRHLRSLDGVRGIAVIAVLGIHAMYMGALPNPPPRPYSLFHIFGFGWMGVDLFFVLSGFLITGILLDTRSSRNYLRSFYARRTLRIFPLYYGVVLILFILSPWLIHTAYSYYVPSRDYWLVYATYMQSWWPMLSPHSYPGVTGLYWTLGIEEQFYLVWPCVVLWCSRRALACVCVAICLLAPLSRLIILLVTHQPQNGYATLATTARIDSLVWGAVAALVVRNPAVLQRARRFLPCIFATAVAGILFIDFPLHELYSRGTFTNTVGLSLISIASASLILMAYVSESLQGRLARYLSHPFLRSWGRYSYGVYVLHAFTVVAIPRYFRRYPWYGRAFLPGLALFLGAFAITWVAAWVTYHGFEKHFLHLKARFSPDARDPSPMPLHASSAPV